MEIQPFTIPDIPGIRRLQPKGWNDITINFMEYCLQPFCMPIKVVDQNSIVGLGTVILHERSAWLAHIIVEESYRGRGIGIQIVKYLVDLATKSGSLSVNLIATDLGAPIYRKTGFTTVTYYQYLKRAGEWCGKFPGIQLKAAMPVHYEQIFGLDQEITGENRRKLIEGQLTRAVIFEKNKLVEGYYFPQLGQGPIYAATDSAGLALMGLKYSTVDTAVLPMDNTIGIDFLIKNGFKRQDTTAIRMTYGKEIYWKPKQIFSRIGGNFG